MGEMVSFASNGNRCEGYLAVPESGRAPGVIVIQEWWGLVDHIKEVTDRVAAEGFVALAPDLYHGETTDEPDEARRMLMGLAMDRAAKDVDGAATYLAGRGDVDGNGVGALGFCMGGSLALWSGTVSARVKAAVGFYPAMPWESMAPTWGSYANKSAMIHASEEDGTSRAAGVQTAVRAIEKAGGDVEVYDYPGSHHAFFNDTRPEVHDKEHSRAAWRRTMDLFRTRL
ncbi:MAG: dienelactone hydrolase family protein [Actinomycetes bacterium]